MLDVTFVHHSCFVVELDHSILIFDYFPPEAVMEYTFSGKLPELDESKHWYVFASHSHRDHFSLDILKWKAPQISYILSKDIRLGKNYLKRNQISEEIRSQITFVGAENHYVIDGICVDTLRSTDQGVAFVVTCEGITVYHAGDLHAWNWDQRGGSYCDIMSSSYQKEISHLKNRHIDIAFVVLDPRLEEGFANGMQYFLAHVDADVVFPMHMWQHYDLIERLKHIPEIVPYQNKIVDIDRENIIFHMES